MSDNRLIEMKLIEERGRQTYFVVQIKNWEPFEFGPELAIDNVPKPLCFSTKFSSANFRP